MSNNPNTFWKRFLAAFCGALAALVVNGIIMMMLFVGLVSIFAASVGKDEAVIVPNNSILTIDLSSPIGERTCDDMDPIALLSGDTFTNTLGIYDAIKAINRASEDDNIKMILLQNSSSTALSISTLEELRQAIEKFRDSGKPVISYGVNYSLGDYCLSSVADKVFMNKAGAGSFLGIGSNMLFYKDLLDKLGIQVQLIRHGKFKSAAEQYVRSDISDENKLQTLEMLGSVWTSLAGKICESRGIKLSDLNKAIDNLELGEAEDLLKHGLVDSLTDGASFNSYLCSMVGVKSEKELKYISLPKYSKTLSCYSKAKDEIAILYAEGEITMAGQGGISAKKLIPQIKKIAADSSVKAVVFRIASPGGDAIAAELIREEVQRLRLNKPVISSYGAYAASGGYWISAQSDAIISNATTLTGSIGVFSMVPNGAKGLKQHLHINAVPLSTHAHSTMLRLTAPLDEAEQAYMERSVEKIYTQFTSLVADGRSMTVAEVDSLGQGRVWTGEQGLKNRLVDGIGTLEDAIALAAEKAGLESYKVVEYPKVKSTMENLLESLSSSGEESARAGLYRMKSLTDLTPEQLVNRLFPDLYKGSNVYAMMPYIYEFNY